MQIQIRLSSSNCSIVECTSTQGNVISPSARNWQAKPNSCLSTGCPISRPQKLPQQKWPRFIKCCESLYLGEGYSSGGSSCCFCSQVGSELGLLQCCPKCPSGPGVLETSRANFWGRFAEGDMRKVSVQKKGQNTGHKLKKVGFYIHQFMKYMYNIHADYASYFFTLMNLK